nr:MAG TPA: hypothetical protein [Caudoviricetes sp.]
MTDRDRLIKILQNRTKDPCHLHGLYEWADDIADYLLENGVIVPPCNVGDHVFVVYGLGVQHTSVSSVKIESEGVQLAFILKCMVLQGVARFEEFLFDKTAFLTRVEAKKALKDRSGK